MVDVRELEMSEEDYEEMLDDIYGSFKIGECEFWAGDILRNMDPTAFRVGLSDEGVQYECGNCNEIFEEEPEAEMCCEEE